MSVGLGVISTTEEQIRRVLYSFSESSSSSLKWWDGWCSSHGLSVEKNQIMHMDCVGQQMKHLSYHLYTCALTTWLICRYTSPQGYHRHPVRVYAWWAVRCLCVFINMLLWSCTFHGICCEWRRGAVCMVIGTHFHVCGYTGTPESPFPSSPAIHTLQNSLRDPFLDFLASLWPSHLKVQIFIYCKTKFKTQNLRARHREEQHIWGVSKNRVCELTSLFSDILIAKIGCTFLPSSLKNTVGLNAFYI